MLTHPIHLLALQAAFNEAVPTELFIVASSIPATFMSPRPSPIFRAWAISVNTSTRRVRTSLALSPSVGTVPSSCPLGLSPWRSQLSRERAALWLLPPVPALDGSLLQPQRHCRAQCQLPTRILYSMCMYLSQLPSTPMLPCPGTVVVSIMY